MLLWFIRNCKVEIVWEVELSRSCSNVHTMFKDKKNGYLVQDLNLGSPALHADMLSLAPP